ncbi:pyridoxal-phosphate dependent enzyme, partial [Candidatus Bathyarchaeota archaeon]|nr:pyridoxal-phosphate dependent enzyme [Candidatus Bathyarchaeota archaeon]
VEGVAGGQGEDRRGRATCSEREKNDPTIWGPRQFSTPDAAKAQNQTAEEILEQAGGSVDAYVSSIGTGGTLMGIAEVLKERLEHVKVIGAYPSSSKKPIVPGQPYPRTDFEGGTISDMMDVPGLVDEVYKVTDEEAVEMAHRLWREEGLFCGISAGANVLIALRVAEKLGKGKKVVTVLPDNGYRYMTDERYVT